MFKDNVEYNKMKYKTISSKNKLVIYIHRPIYIYTKEIIPINAFFFVNSSNKI